MCVYRCPALCLAPGAPSCPIPQTLANAAPCLSLLILQIVAYESLRKRGRSSLNSITSYHLIRSAEFDDAGNYTCAPELYPSASTIVHILDGRWDGDRDVRWRQCVGAIFNALAVARSLPALLVAFAGEEAQELSSSNRGPWLSALTKLLYGTLVPLSVLYNHRDRMS